ncbi:MAG: pyridoxamine 5'-phosphate oxidase family protein [Desulfobacterales bacterium]
MSKELMEYFNKQPRLGTLSSAGKDGKVDVAYFGSAHMTDEKTVVIGMGNNRTFSNLKENPNAVFMIMEPGESPAQWKGVRVYLKMTDHQTSGRKLDEVRAQIAQKVGAEIANKMIHAYVALEIEDIRPFADFGQSWMKSIGK